jgi:hypothetical protein
MPRALEPGQRFSVVLDSDEDKPVATRPTFWFVTKSVRDWKAGRETIIKNLEADAWDATLAMLRLSLVGWDNMTDPETQQPIAFNLDDLDRLVDFTEAQELLDKIRFGPRDKKK